MLGYARVKVSFMLFRRFSGSHLRPSAKALQLTAALLTSALLTACTDAPPQPASRPHIVLISVDTLRPDHLGSYGYERPTSPSIDRLASEGALFEVVTSSSSWTLPAHAALFTGLPDSVHGADRSSRQLIADRYTLAESLQEVGYRTVGIWSGPLLDPQFGFGQGFETYWGHRDPITGDGAEGAEAQTDWNAKHLMSHQDVTGPAILKKVEAALAADDGRPLFLFVHLWDPHYDYLAPSPDDGSFASGDYQGPVDGQNVATYLDLESLPEPDLQHLIDLYDDEIAWTDQQIGDIVAHFERRGMLDQTAVVVTADHGEEFFEHGAFGHRRHLYDASIRIPLVMRYPERVSAGQRIETPTGIIDVAPTLIEWAGAEPLPQILGRSLQPLLDGEVPTEGSKTISELVYEGDPEGSQLAVRTADWKLIARGQEQRSFELYDLTSDPEEQVDVYGVDPDLTRTAQAQFKKTSAELAALRDQHIQLRRKASRLPADMVKQLRALGYLGTEIGEESPIWALPNPIEKCVDDVDDIYTETTLHWDAPEITGPVQIMVWPAGTVFATAGTLGSQTTGNWVTDGMEFSLVDTQTGDELGRTEIQFIRVACSD